MSLEGGRLAFAAKQADSVSLRECVRVMPDTWRSGLFGNNISFLSPRTTPTDPPDPAAEAQNQHTPESGPEVADLANESLHANQGGNEEAMPGTPGDATPAISNHANHETATL